MTMKKHFNEFIATLENTPHFAWVIELLKQPKVEVYVVGGKVRDILLQRESDDIDFVVRNMPGEQLQAFLEQHGTVNMVGKSFGVFIFKPTGYEGNAFEIALPRTEVSFNTGGYHDFDIHSDYTLPLTKDLIRRDFTINAMALNIATRELVDPHKGQEDLKKKIVRAVGSPTTRFKEDYTRMMRCVRFAAQLHFEVDPKTLKALTSLSKHVTDTPAERTQNELNKILLSKNVEDAFELLRESKMLHHLLPEIAENIGVEQGKSHIYTVYEHLIKATQWASEKEYPLDVVMAALFHDCGKKRTRAIINGVDTYYNHEYVGEKMTREALNRLKYPKDFIKDVAHLVKHHMFYYNLGEVSDAGIRRLIAKVGGEYVERLIQLRMADRKGMGRPKAKPYKLEELEKRIRILQSDPISVKMLAIGGDELMPLLNLTPGVRLKYLKNALLNKVLDDPMLNTKEQLEDLAKELNQLSDEELRIMEPNFDELERDRKKELLKGFKGAH